VKKLHDGDACGTHALVELHEQNCAADLTVIAALAAEGVQVPTSCEQGVCGTCLTRVLEGEPDHRDLYLTPEEQAGNDQFLPCCSRAKSGRLVLDL
jgi:vanillate monooxygenase ferredoxin subunit